MPATGDVPVPPEEPAAGPQWNNLTPSASIPRSWGHPVSLPGTQQPTGPAHQRDTRPRPRPPAGHARKHGGYWQTVEWVQQYRERRAITDPDRPLEQELASRDLEQHRHYRISRQPLGRLQQLQRAFGLEPRRRPTAGWAQGPGQGGTIGPRQAVVPNGGQENKGIRAAAGGSLPALNPVKGAITHQRGR